MGKKGEKRAPAAPGRGEQGRVVGCWLLGGKDSQNESEKESESERFQIWEGRSKKGKKKGKKRAPAAPGRGEQERVVGCQLLVVGRVVFRRGGVNAEGPAEVGQRNAESRGLRQV
jgi:hypothetical protein